MNSINKWLSIAVPAGWADVMVRTVKVAVAAFLIFHLKEWIDAGKFDTPDIAIDSAWLAGGSFVLNAILLLASPRSSRPQPLAQQGTSPER
jgi:hypothetical protein